MIKYVVRLFLSLTVILFVLPSPAYAHPIEGSGLASGFAHLFLGLDHLIAILVVGTIITAQIIRKVLSKNKSGF